MNKHLCHAKNCTVQIPQESLFCRTHWKRLPARYRTAVQDYYRPGQEIDKRPSREWTTAARAAIQWLETDDARKTPIDQPLDPGIEPLVTLLRRHGFDTFASCEGGPGHTFQHPTVLIQPDPTREIDRTRDDVALALYDAEYSGYYVSAVYAYQLDDYPVLTQSYIKVELWSDNGPQNLWKERAEALLDIARAAENLVGGNYRILSHSGRVLIPPGLLDNLQKALEDYRKKDGSPL